MINMTSMRFLLLFSMSLLFLHAEEAGVPAVLLFDNGDRLHGQYLGTDADGYLEFASPLLGILRVPSDQASIEQIVPAQPETPDVTPDAPDAEARDDTPFEEEEPKPKWEKPDIPGLTWIRYPSNWTGRLRFSVDILRRTDSNYRFNLDNLINIRRERDRFQIQGRYEYETVRPAGRTLRDRYEGRLRYDHDVSENNFFQSETFYGVDRVKLIEHQVRQSIGYGFLWNGSNNFEFQVVPGLSGSYLDQITDDEQEVWLVLGRLFQSFKYRFSENYALNQTFEGFFRADDPDNYELNFRVGFVSSLTRKLALEIDYEYEFDNTLATGISRQDTRLRANLIFQY